MMAPPGYPKITSPPASTSARHRIAAPESISLIGSHSPEVAGIERLVLQLIRVAHLVEGMHQGTGARLDDVGRGPVPGERFPVDPRLHQHLPQTVTPRGDRLDGEVQYVHLAPHDLRDRRECGGDRPVADRRRAPLRPIPGT